MCQNCCRKCGNNSLHTEFKGNNTWLYCDVCGKEVETKIITRQETFKVCGEDITIDAQVFVCAECGEELFCEELDSATLVNAYNEYRRKHKFLLPDEIKKIREQYGLSQRNFAKLLNLGDKTICRYENGSVQDKAHNSLLLFLREPENMRTYLTKNEIMLNERQKTKLLDTVEKLEQDTEHRVHFKCKNKKEVLDAIERLAREFQEELNLK